MPCVERAYTLAPRREEAHILEQDYMSFYRLVKATSLVDYPGPLTSVRGPPDLVDRQ